MSGFKIYVVSAFVGSALLSNSFANERPNPARTPLPSRGSATPSVQQPNRQLNPQANQVQSAPKRAGSQQRQIQQQVNPGATQVQRPGKRVGNQGQPANRSAQVYQTPQNQVSPNQFFPTKRVEQRRAPLEQVDSQTRDRYDYNFQRMRQMQDNRQIRGAVELHQRRFEEQCFDNLRYREQQFKHFHRHFGNHYHGYWGYGFHGGFSVQAVAVDPVPMFLNPFWASFYVRDFDPNCRRAWNGGVVVVPVFQYQTVYYPTFQFQTIVVNISALSLEKQNRFQEAMNLLTEQLALKLAAITRQAVALNSSDIVISETQMLRDDAVAVEGYVSHDGPYTGMQTKFGFKAFLDLRDPYELTSLGRVAVFVPNSFEGAPDESELVLLNQINSVILTMGGRVDYQ